MVLTLEEIDKRIAEIPQQVASLTTEQHQLIGYKKALEDVEAEATPKNGEVMSSPHKERKSKVAKGV